MSPSSRFSIVALLALTPTAGRAQQAWESLPIVEGTGRAAVTLPRADAAIQVDGVLDEPAWASAVRLGSFWQYEPVDGLRAEDQTEILAWYSATAVHFGIVAHDRAPSSIRATVADRDAIGGDDHVVLYLDTFDDQRRAFFFGVNPLGVQTDGVRTEGGVGAGNMFGGVSDDSPDYLWQSAGRITETGWVAEIRIPFESLSLPSEEPQSWSFQALRIVQRTGHTYAWTDARRAAASFLLQAGRFEGIVGVERGVTLEAQPFVTVGLNRELRPVLDSPEAEWADDGWQPEVGVNLHAGFGAHALDLTLNPDFSQVEADAARVTTNERFALFFPEKRPFFLEGIELFATPNQLVYTRRIVDPIVGAKGAGKIGPFGYAAISALDEGAEGASDALFNIVRLRSDFGTNSLAGIVVTDRTELDDDVEDDLQPGARYNRVVAADVRHVFRELYFIEAQIAQSFTGHDGLGSRDGQLWELTYDRTGRLWGFNYSLEGVSPAFNADAGFINRTDYVSGRAFNRLRFYGDPEDRVQTLTIFGGGDRVWSYGRQVGENDAFFEGGLLQPIEGGENVNFDARLRGGWDMQLSPGRGFVVFDPLDYAGFTVENEDGGFEPYSPLRRFSGWGAGFEIETPTFQTWEADVGMDIGETAIFAEGAEGFVTQLEAGVGLRPTPWLRMGVEAAWQRITRARDDSEFATAFIPRVQAEVQPSRALFFRLIGEWSDEARAALVDARLGRPLFAGGGAVPAFEGRALRLDLLASYEPTPGTVAFLGYGATFGAGDEFAFRRDDVIRREDGFFAKVAYRWRL